MSLLSNILAFIYRSDELSLWTISTYGRVVGSLAYEAGEWRLSWFEDADPRLRSYRGPVIGDLASIAEVLSTRAGRPVSLDAVMD